MIGIVTGLIIAVVTYRIHWSVPMEKLKSQSVHIVCLLIMTELAITTRFSGERPFNALINWGLA